MPYTIVWDTDTKMGMLVFFLQHVQSVERFERTDGGTAYILVVHKDLAREFWLRLTSPYDNEEDKQLSLMDAVKRLEIACDLLGLKQVMLAGSHPFPDIFLLSDEWTLNNQLRERYGLKKGSLSIFMIGFYEFR